MAIVKMKRLRMIALNNERDEILARLLHLGCVEVTEPEGKLADPQWAALLRRDTTTLGEAKTQAAAVASALDTLAKYAPYKKGLFVVRESIHEADFLCENAKAAALETASQINQRAQQINQSLSQETRLTAQRVGFAPWMGLDISLETAETQAVKVIFATCPAAASLAELQAVLEEKAPLSQLVEASQDEALHYFVLIYHKTEQENIQEVLKRFTVSTLSFKGSHGTAAENIAAVDQELASSAAKRDALIAEIAALADQRKALQFCLDALDQEISKQTSHERLLTDGTIVFLEGWATVPGLPRLEEELSKFSVAWETSDPQEDEEPPVLLRNSKLITPINMVTEMYALPSYRGIDPNPLIFWFYITFFGFMFADIGYGIILFVISLIITKKFHPKGTMGYMFGLGQYLGVTTFLFGIITGGFFGDVITVFCATFLGKPGVALPYLINPLSDPMSVLIVAIGMGIVQLLFGQCVHIYMECRDGHPMEGILDVVPWWIVFAGIGALALGSGSTVILVGFASLVLTQGRHNKGLFGKLFGGVASLYDVTSWLSDVLSYSRLMALMLATSVIASVMNTLGALPKNIIAFVIIFCIGHVFNIGVNIIGTYVHAARLQYLEFFGKFYKEGGVPFRPLQYNTKYVDIIEEEK